MGGVGRPLPLEPGVTLRDNKLRRRYSSPFARGQSTSTLCHHSPPPLLLSHNSTMSDPASEPLLPPSPPPTAAPSTSAPPPPTESEQPTPEPEDAFDDLPEDVRNASPEDIKLQARLIENDIKVRPVTSVLRLRASVESEGRQRRAHGSRA